MRQFACEEIVCPPGGPRENQPFDLDTQPWTRLWFDLVESGQFPRFAVTGCTQNGKSFVCYVIPALYYLFERGEHVGCGVPQMEMAFDKWKRDFEPVIRASRYRDLIPEIGTGSKGGKFESITFKNGATLKFLSAKGGDEKRSGITLRVLVITEVDKFDEASSGSRETDPVSQMIARLDAFHTMNTIVFMECTVSIESGRIWKEYSAGTQSRIAMPCPHCHSFVTPEREHLIGYQTAATEVDAREAGAFICPNCSRAWTESQRYDANRNAVLVHKGQEIGPDGAVVGPVPKTLTAGFRWNAAQNMLRPAADIAGAEWKAKNDPDNEAADKALSQFTWVKPWLGETSGTGITQDIVASKLSGLDRGVPPEDTETLVAQIDMHLRWLYWTVLATSANRVRTIIDYGIHWNPDKSIHGPEEAMRLGLEALADEIEDRQYVTDEGRIIEFDLGLVDGGFHQEIAVEFCRLRTSRKWRVSKGEGRNDQDGGRFRIEKKRTFEIRPGDHWCDRRQPGCEASLQKPWWLIFADTEFWMHRVHGGFMAATYLEDGETRRPGSIVLFGSDPAIHLRNTDAEIMRSSFAAQILGWVWKSEKIRGKGQRLGWNAEWKEDHWFDTTYGTLVADSVVRAYHPRFRTQPAVVVTSEENKRRPETPDGRPYLLTER